MSKRGETRSERPAASELPGGDGDDLRLLARINAGDAQALHALYLKYYHRLLRFIHRITGQIDAAQEVINDVMLVVWLDGKAFAGRSSVGTWILGIAYRKALKLAEQSRRRSGRSVNVELEDWSERFPAAEELSERVEVEDWLEQGLGRLTPEQKAVVELTYYFGCSYEEIASITGCPVNTVKTRMFYAREKLRKLLPELGKDGSIR
jgi:RNA polymerase sigma-70 factor (ECF subfamily)